jgi:hypothetical protein
MFCPGHQLNFTTVSATRLELVAPVVDLFGREQGYHPNSAVPDQSRPFFPIISIYKSLRGIFGNGELALGHVIAQNGSDNSSVESRRIDPCSNSGA